MSLRESEPDYDGENRLVEVKKNSAVIGQLTYDGYGRRVKGTTGRRL